MVPLLPLISYSSFLQSYSLSLFSPTTTFSKVFTYLLLCFLQSFPYITTLLTPKFPRYLPTLLPPKFPRIFLPCIFKKFPRIFPRCFLQSFPVSSHPASSKVFPLPILLPPKFSLFLHCFLQSFHLSNPHSYSFFPNLCVSSDEP